MVSQIFGKFCYKYSTIWRIFEQYFIEIREKFAKGVKENFRKIFAKIFRFLKNSTINILQVWRIFEENFILIWEKFAIWKIILKNFRMIFAMFLRFSENSAINIRQLWRKFYWNMRKIFCTFKKSLRKF